MFLVLFLLKDAISVSPSQFNQPFRTAVATEINAKYSNKVIPNIGLCIEVFDILSTMDPIVHPGEGSYEVEVEFRLIVFKPFVGEILEGRISSCSLAGIHVSLQFFDDIIIPPLFLNENTFFDEKDQAWIWHYEGEKMYMDIGENIRFRVVNFQFHENCPNAMQMKKKQLQFQQQQSPQQTSSDDTKEDIIPTFSLTGAINEPGLGCVRWWSGEEDEPMNESGASESAMEIVAA